MRSIQTQDDVPAIRPFFEFGDELMETITHLLESGHVSNNGKNVQTFERLLAEYLGAGETVIVSSGFEALLLALKALSMAPGKAILPAYTYIATLNAVVHSGFEPVFCEIEPASFTMDVQMLAKLLEQHSDVSCVMPVNVFGIPPDLAAIRGLCDKSEVRLVYDNAHGFGTEVDGRRIQSEPDAQIFSLHATKALPAVEGGFVVSDDSEVLAKVKRLRNHGLGGTVAETEPGFNAKMDEIRAVIGIESLRHFPATLPRRRKYGARLLERFKRFEDVYAAQIIPATVNTNFQNLGVCVSPRFRVTQPELIEMFASHGIGVRSYFSPPLYKFAGFDEGPALPVTESVWQTLLSFPIHSRMPEDTLIKIENAIDQVAETLRTKH
jgi:dTDP-4-amino-4,6-dideoxygalactose transaminase